MKQLLKLLILVLFLNQTTIMYSATQRQKINFNHNWKLFVGDTEKASEPSFDDNSWKEVTLPFAWNQEEAFKNDIVDLSTGIAWYRKHFKIPAEYKGMKVFVEFEGVRQAGEVYLNGKYLGIHENGITAFGFDISELIFFGDKENVIAVRTDNSWDYVEKNTGSSFQWNDKNFNANYGGIPKNVVLHITGKTYQTLPLLSSLNTTGQYIYGSDFNISGHSAVVTVETEVKNENKKDIKLNLEVQIEDFNGDILVTYKSEEYTLKSNETKILKASEPVNNLNFWSWGYGYLYKVHSILKNNNEIIDKVTTVTGFRKTEFGKGLVKLNDRVIQVKGYAQRTSNEWPALGMSVSPWMSDFSNKLMVESNANLVRWMHVAPWKQDVESCDRVGLMQAMPSGDSEKDRQGRQWEQRVEVMQDAIVYYRNNPSIIFYESGNKGISEEHMQEMKALRDKYDPFGGRAAGCREMLNSKIAEYGGEMLYVNKSDEKPVWAMEYMRDEGLRAYWDDYTFPYHKDGDGPLHKGKDASAYNRNQDSHACEAVIRWFDYFRERPGTGKRVSSGGVNIIFSDSNTHHRGTENYRRSGEVDAVRVAKDAFYANQVIWNGWVDIEKPGSHIVGHWNYEPGTIKNIYVISTGESVELFLNDESLGFGNKDYGFLFTFDSIAFQPGELKAVSYNSEHEIVDTKYLHTADKPENIKLTLIAPEILRANGADMFMVDVEVVDKNGQRCPVAFDTIHFQLEGEAKWIGGIARGENNYILSKTLPVECGINRVIVRSTIKAGQIKILAKANHLKPDSLKLSSIPVEVKEGLAYYAPSDGLKPDLKRGPTPLGLSYVEKRKNVEIIAAKAGANQDKAVLSYDGNQDTRWSNDGKIANGWIEYKLEKVAGISEIALKLSGWRTRSYPIVISANDSVVYQGITSPNLGFYYVTFTKPVKTDNLKIRLYSETEFTDRYKLVEITGKLDRETENDLSVKNARSLNIVDVEVFEDL